MLNVTAVNPSADGYLTVFPSGAAPPLASHVNYSAHDVVPTALFAKIGAAGKVRIFALATSDIVIDLNGYVPPAA